ncbi:MAG TPA: iron ABC transporter permease [Ferrovibrio sp.]|uniref:ABC transporter permease n=1 Tax=Ferrovibrio sp. TaxID=1917215 RepID=UPI002ED00348
MTRTRAQLVWLLIAIVGFLTLCPVLMLLAGSFSQGLTAFGAFTAHKYVAAYTDPALAGVIVNTLVFVLGASLFSTVLAIFLSYLNTRTNIPWKGAFTLLSIVPMMIPHLLFAISWALLLNPSNGLMNLVLRGAFGLEQSPINIYSIGGMIFVEGLLNLPIAYLVIAPAMGAFDVSLEESSRVSGAGTLTTLRRITLPILRPAILAAFTLCVVRALASYAVPRALGTPGRVDVLATYLYEMISTGFAPDYGQAAALGMSVLSASILLIVLYRALTAEGGKFVTISSRGFKPAIIDLKGARLPLFVVVALLCLLMIVIPVGALFYTSLLPYSMVPGARALALMSWQNWIEMVHDDITMRALQNSLILAIVGASLGVLLSLFAAYVTVKLRTKAAGLLEMLTFLSFSFPGIVIGIGFMWFFVQTPLYATLTAMMLAYIAAYLPYGVRPLTSAFVQVHAHLEESSQVCGAPPLTTMRRIVAPLVLPGIVSAWILMATMFIRELSVSVVLSRPGSEVLAVRILNFADDGLWGKLSALGIVMILLSTGMVLAATYAGRKFKRH